MRPQTAFPTFKHPPAAPERVACTAALLPNAPAVGGSRDQGMATRDGLPEGDSFSINLAGAEDLAGRTTVAACVYLFTLTPMRDTLKTTLLVPKVGNDGVAFTDDEFRILEGMLLDLAGGYTRLADVEGAWKAPDGSIMRDASRCYSITVDVDQAERVIHSVDRFIREFFQQRAALVEATPTKATVF